MWTTLIILSFLCGSLPCGVLIARSRGINIREHGSGNVGATNVWRVLGHRWGLLCFAVDVLKGFIPTLGAGLIMQLVFFRTDAGIVSPKESWWWLAVMAAAVLGHIYSPWIGFRGGKGVATGLGAMLGLFPYLTVPAVAAFAVWGIVVAAWRYVSLASCAAAVALPVLVYAWGIALVNLNTRLNPQSEPAHRAGIWPLVIVTGAMGLLVVYKHRGNIRRLIAGKESRMDFRIKRQARAAR
jgi:glycerol-3-phosphate acyltransferase PlsY